MGDWGVFEAVTVGGTPVGTAGPRFVGYAIPIGGQLPGIPAYARRVAAAVEKESRGAASIRHARRTGPGRRAVPLMGRSPI